MECITTYIFYKTEQVQVQMQVETSNITITYNDDLKKRIEDLTFDSVESSCAIRGVVKMDPSIRSSQTSKRKVEIKISGLYERFESVQFDDMFDVITYNVGDKFTEHTDAVKFKTHNYTILLYPPQNVEGGDLIVKLDGDKNFAVKMSNCNWTIVLLPVKVPHSSLPVLNGTKLTFKGAIGLTGTKFDCNGEESSDLTSSEDIEDDAFYDSSNDD